MPPLALKLGRLGTGRYNLGNERGATFETSAPVPACKPDLRHYPKSKVTRPEGLTKQAGRAYSEERKRTRPPEVRWRDKYGVCDEADGIVTYTGKCQRDGCKSGGTCGHRKCRGYFSVQREAGNHAAWPKFCSDECRSLSDRARWRRNKQRQRKGETSGAKRPLYRTFDPDAPGAYDLARTIVEQAPGHRERWDTWATDRVLDAAKDYLAQCDQEVAAQDAALRAEWDTGDD